MSLIRGGAASTYKALKDYTSSFAAINSLLQIEPRHGPAQKLRQEGQLELKLKGQQDTCLTSFLCLLVGPDVPQSSLLCPSET